MKHPLHGVIHAVGAEIDWNKAHGWTVCGSDTAVDLTEFEKLAARYEAKFGKPPHHRMLEATIKEALGED